MTNYTYPVIDNILTANVTPLAQNTEPGFGIQPSNLYFPAPPPPESGLVAGGQTQFYTHTDFIGIMTATVTIPAQNTADDYIFVAPMALGYNGPAALMILDNDGEPVYIKTFPCVPFVGDFNKQTVNGNDYLTYHVGVAPAAIPMAHLMY